LFRQIGGLLHEINALVHLDAPRTGWLWAVLENRQTDTSQGEVGAEEGSRATPCCATGNQTREGRHPPWRDHTLPIRCWVPGRQHRDYQIGSTAAKAACIASASLPLGRPGQVEPSLPIVIRREARHEDRRHRWYRTHRQEGGREPWRERPSGHCRRTLNRCERPYREGDLIGVGRCPGCC